MRSRSQEPSAAPERPVRLNTWRYKTCARYVNRSATSLMCSISSPGNRPSARRGRRRTTSASGRGRGPQHGGARLGQRVGADHPHHVAQAGTLQRSDLHGGTTNQCWPRRLSGLLAVHRPRAQQRSALTADAHSPLNHAPLANGIAVLPGHRAQSVFIGEQERRALPGKECEVFLRHAHLPGEWLQIPPHDGCMVKARRQRQLPMLVVIVEA